MPRRRQDTTSATSCVIPCTLPPIRSSRARMGWSGSAHGLDPDRRTPASIPGRPPAGRWAVSWPTWSGAGTPGAAVHRRPVRWRTVHRRTVHRRTVRRRTERGAITRGVSRGTGRTGYSGRPWRWPASCSPSAWPWPCLRCARPSSSSARRWGLPPTPAAAPRARPDRATRCPRRPAVSVRAASPAARSARFRPGARRVLRRPSRVRRTGPRVRGRPLRPR